MVELFSDIDTYLETTGFGKPISIVGLENIREAIIANTSLDEASADVIIRLYFHEIRNSLLKGEKVYLKNFGTFYVSSPKISNNKRNVFIKFSISKPLKRRLNA